MDNVGGWASAPLVFKSGHTLAWTWATYATVRDPKYGEVQQTTDGNGHDRSYHSSHASPVSESSVTGILSFVNLQLDMEDPTLLPIVLPKCSAQCIWTVQ